MTQDPKKEQSTDKEQLQRRIVRLERNYLILGISVFLLAIASIRLGNNVSRIVETFEFLTKQISLICQ